MASTEGKILAPTKRTGMGTNETSAEKIADEIIALGPRIERAIGALTKRLNEIEAPLDQSTVFESTSYWQVAAIRGGMIKVDITIKQSFRHIEIFSLLGVTRYIFELLIWFRLLTSGNTEYARRYTRELMTDNWSYAVEQLDKLRSEIELFKELHAKENDEVDKAAKAAVEKGEEDAIQFKLATQMIAQQIDLTARRHFSVHADGAKTRGYGFQAHLLETQAAPELERNVKRTEGWKDKAVGKPPKKDPRWNWEQMARAVGMGDQYDFLYRYTSRILHARPISFHPGQHNLDAAEKKMFLDFVFVSILEMTEISERLACIPSPEAN